MPPMFSYKWEDMQVLAWFICTVGECNDRTITGHDLGTIVVRVEFRNVTPLDGTRCVKKVMLLPDLFRVMAISASGDGETTCPETTHEDAMKLLDFTKADATCCRPIA